MKDLAQSLTIEDVASAKERRLVAMHLQEIESNPLSPDQIEMFEMFEREAWPHERRLSYILERAKAGLTISAAE
jgi:hypothetical protein